MPARIKQWDSKVWLAMPHLVSGAVTKPINMFVHRGSEGRERGGHDVCGLWSNPPKVKVVLASFPTPRSHQQELSAPARPRHVDVRSWFALSTRNPFAPHRYVFERLQRR
eukprot:366268-Chlamydomonas_euryale.AAC.15